MTSTALPNVSNLRVIIKETKVEDRVRTSTVCNLETLKKRKERTEVLTAHPGLNQPQSAMTANSSHHSHGKRDLSSEV